ncbi:MAG TPA: alpha/beta hydrolase [Pseudomonas sp.]|nr:alpha/beta hydrolase [Pseudomonas sp.]
MSISPRNWAAMTALVAASSLSTFSAVAAPIAPPSDKATVILVHGAFAESSSWNGVASRLQAEGYPVIAVANPLRSVKGDSDYVSQLVEHTKGPVILVGHSYGGQVISDAVHGNANVKALVYVAAFAPEKGETVLELSGRYPGGTLGPTLADPVTLIDGNQDLYIQQDKFAEQFAADVAPADAALMAATQRPITTAALGEPAVNPAWKYTPSWFIYGSADKNIPEAALKFMADRAGSKKTVVIDGASHVVMTSNPQQVADLIDEAAQATSR